MKITGTVIKGEGQGFKTANLKADRPFKLADGVYLAKVKCKNKEYQGLAIMGIRKDIEVYLLDFKGDLYNKILEVEVLKKMRELVKLEKEELLEQIEEDVVEAKVFFENNN